MAKKIDLKFFINKNRISLKTFCTINNIKSYEELKKHCEQKNIVCVDESFYCENFPPKIVKKVQKKENTHVKESKSKTATKKGRSSRTHKTRNTRTTNKKDDT